MRKINYINDLKKRGGMRVFVRYRGSPWNKTQIFLPLRTTLEHIFLYLINQLESKFQISIKVKLENTTQILSWMYQEFLTSSFNLKYFCNVFLFQFLTKHLVHSFKCYCNVLLFQFLSKQWVHTAQCTGINAIIMFCFFSFYQNSECTLHSAQV